MKKTISLFLLFISFTTCIYSQNQGKIIVKKSVAEGKINDSTFLIGKWVRLNNYKKENIWPNQRLENEFIDTLYFTSNYKYMERRSGKGANANWFIAEKNGFLKYPICIHYTNFEYFFIKDGKTYKSPIKGDRTNLYEEFGIIANDTIGILHATMEDGAAGIRGDIYYYVRAK